MITKKLLKQIKKMDTLGKEIDWKELVYEARGMKELTLPVTDNPLTWSAAFTASMTMLKRADYSEMTGTICRLIILSENILKKAGVIENENLKIFKGGKDEL